MRLASLLAVSIEQAVDEAKLCLAAVSSPAVLIGLCRVSLEQLW